MPYTRLIVHAVWSVKDWKPMLFKANRDALCCHILEYAAKKNIHIIRINGWLDHIHWLVSLSADQNIAAVMNLIKGEFSYWANRNLEWPEKFGWQNDYFAVSVSRSHEKKVIRYIENQEVHHKAKTFQEEYDDFICKYRFEE